MFIPLAIILLLIAVNVFVSTLIKVARAGQPHKDYDSGAALAWSLVEFAAYIVALVGAAVILWQLS